MTNIDFQASSAFQIRSLEAGSVLAVAAACAPGQWKEAALLDQCHRFLCLCSLLLAAPLSPCPRSPGCCVLLLCEYPSHLTLWMKARVHPLKLGTHLLAILHVSLLCPHCPSGTLATAVSPGLPIPPPHHSPQEPQMRLLQWHLVFPVSSPCDPTPPSWSFVIWCLLLCSDSSSCTFLLLIFPPDILKSSLTCAPIF